MAQTKDSDLGFISLEPRVIPIPTSISDEAQAVLRAAVTAEGVPMNALHPAPDAADHQAWRQLQAAVDGAYAAQVAGLAVGAAADIETLTLEDTTIHVATPPDVRRAGIYIDLHGGALVFGGGAACKAGATVQADLHGMVCHGVDYRRPPDHPFPAALDDSLAAYRHAVQTVGAHRVVLGGRSAGGNLAVATLLRAQKEGLPMPAALVLLSPEVDLTESGDSFATNRMLDTVLPVSLMPNNLLYAGGADLSDPSLSPLFGAFTADFPPTFLQSGTRDQFLSNTVRLHRRLRRAGVAAELHIWEAMPHGGFGGGTPEDRELTDEIAGFVNAHLH